MNNNKIKLFEDNDELIFQLIISKDNFKKFVHWKEQKYDTFQNFLIERFNESAFLKESGLVDISINGDFRVSDYYEYTVKTTQSSIINSELMQGFIQEHIHLYDGILNKVTDNHSYWAQIERIDDSVFLQYLLQKELSLKENNTNKLKI